MLSIFRRKSIGLSSSKLFDQETFYKAFKRDLQGCQREVIIESPFLTTRRVETLLPTLKGAATRGVRIVVNTRDPYERKPYDAFAVDAIAELQSVGVEVFYTGKHHRKLAIFDRAILWEGSLNILSQNDSCEIMRRSRSAKLVNEMIKFTKLDSFLND